MKYNHGLPGRSALGTINSPCPFSSVIVPPVRSLCIDGRILEALEAIYLYLEKEEGIARRRRLLPAEAAEGDPVYWLQFRMSPEMNHITMLLGVSQ